MIYQVFGLDRDDPPYLKEADLGVLATEKRDVMSHMSQGHDWELELPEPFQEKILPASSVWAERAFMIRFNYLQEQLQKVD